MFVHVGEDRQVLKIHHVGWYRGRRPSGSTRSPRRGPVENEQIVAAGHVGRHDFDVLVGNVGAPVARLVDQNISRIAGAAFPDHHKVCRWQRGQVAPRIKAVTTRASLARGDPPWTSTYRPFPTGTAEPGTESSAMTTWKVSLPSEPFTVTASTMPAVPKGRRFRHRASRFARLPRSGPESEAKHIQSDVPGDGVDGDQIASDVLSSTTRSAVPPPVGPPRPVPPP